MVILTHAGAGSRYAPLNSENVSFSIDYMFTLGATAGVAQSRLATQYTFYVMGGPQLSYVQTMVKTTRRNITGDKITTYPVVTLASTVLSVANVNFAHSTRPHISLACSCIDRVV